MAVEVINRENTKCLKWDLRCVVGGTDSDIPLWIADMDFAVEERVTEALKKRCEHPVFGYTFQDESYRESICGWYLRRHQLTLDPNWLLPCQSVLGAMQLTLNMLIEPGNPVMLFTPVYPQFFGLIKTAGGLQNEYSIQMGEEINWEEVEMKIASSKAVIFCNPHNPIAKVWTDQECRRLAELCQKYQVWLLSDEVHGDMTLFGNQYHCMADFEEVKDKVIVYTSAAKSFNLAGLGGACLIIPGSDLRERTTRQLESFFQTEVNIMAAEAIEAAYRYGDNWVDDIRSYLEMNVGMVKEYIAGHMPKLKCHGHEGTFLMWIDCRALNLPEGDLAGLLAHNYHVLLDDGERYGKEGKGFIRVNVACSREILLQALQNVQKLYVALENNYIN